MCEYFAILLTCAEDAEPFGKWTKNHIE